MTDEEKRLNNNGFHFGQGVLKRAHMSALSLAVFLGVLALSPAHAALSCKSLDTRLACFHAYKANLRSFHYGQLDRIADQVAAKQTTSKPINSITIVGHGVKFKATDPYHEMSVKRAQNVRAELEKRLLARSVDLTKIGIADAGAAATSSVTTNDTKKGRAINRRVEILLAHVPLKAPPKGACKPDIAMAKTLASMRPTGTDRKRRKRVARLRGLLVGHFECDFNLDDYYKDDTPDGAHLLPEFQANCAGKSGRPLAICMNQRHDDILFMVNHTMGAILEAKSVYGATPSEIRKMEECKVGRYFLKKSGSDKSVYRAFRPIVQSGFKLCK